MPIDPVLAGPCSYSESDSNAWNSRIESCPISGVAISGVLSRHSSVTVSNGRGNEMTISRIIYMSSSRMKFRMNANTEAERFMMESDGGIPLAKEVVVLAPPAWRRRRQEW